MIPYRKLKWLFVFFGFNTCFCFFFFDLVIFFFVTFTSPWLLMVSCVILILIFPYLGIFFGVLSGISFVSGLFAFGAIGMAIVSSDNIHSILIVLFVKVWLKELSMVIFSFTFSVCTDLLDEQDEKINVRKIIIICFMVLRN